jgi:hypothetical protein
MEEPVIAHQILVPTAGDAGLHLTHLHDGLNGLCVSHEALESHREHVLSLCQRVQPPVLARLPFPYHLPQRDLPLEHLILLFPGAFEFLILGGLVRNIEIENPVLDGLLFNGLGQVDVHLEDPVEQRPAFIDGLVRNIDADAILPLRLNLPRSFAGLLAVPAVRGKVEFDFAFRATLDLPVGPEAKILEDLFLDLLRAGDLVLFAHVFHHRVVSVLDGVFRPRSV